MIALILIDIQNDFCPNGKLAILDGDKIIDVANKMQKHFSTILASQDWHPDNHLSFASQHKDKNIGDKIILAGIEQNLWADHCVQGTFGAELRQDLEQSKIAKIFKKGVHKTVDSYSAFFDMGKKFDTGLSKWLKSKKITKLFVLGLATDYCVKYTVLDALAEGFATFVISDGCKAVNLHSDDGVKALTEMQNKGAKIIVSQQVQNYL